VTLGPSHLSGTSPSSVVTPPPRPGLAENAPVSPAPAAGQEVVPVAPPDCLEVPRPDGQPATRIALPATPPSRTGSGTPPSELDGLLRDPSLEKQLKDTLARHGLRDAGAVVMDLDRGIFAGQNEGGAYSPASVIKVPVMVEVMKQVEAGQLAYSGNVRELVEKMIIHSDNQATNQLIARVDPTRTRVTATMREILGNGDIRLFNPMFASNPKQLNQGSARAFAMLLKRIEEGRVVSPEASARMKAIMGRNVDDSMLGLAVKGLEDTRLFNKTGSHNHALNDAGIIEVGDRRLVFAIFTRQDGRSRAATDRIARVTHDLLESL
jgi:beta-lactamase class A